MKIKIRYYTFFKQTTNIGEEIVELKDIEHSLDEVADIISSKYGSKFRDLILDSKTNKHKMDFAILVNGLRGKWDQKILPGDIISFLPIFAGG